MATSKGKTLLVTVGTVGFDELVKKVDSPAMFEALKKNGFKYLIINYGRWAWMWKYNQRV